MAVQEGAAHRVSQRWRKVLYKNAPGTLCHTSATSSAVGRAHGCQLVRDCTRPTTLLHSRFKRSIPLLMHGAVTVVALEGAMDATVGMRKCFTDAHAFLTPLDKAHTHASHILCDAPPQCTRFSLHHLQHCFCSGATRWGAACQGLHPSHNTAPFTLHPFPRLFKLGRLHTVKRHGERPACGLLVTHTDVLFSKGHSRGGIAGAVQEVVMSKMGMSTA